MARGSDKYFGSHELQARKEEIKASSDRGFGLVFAVVFVLLAGVGYHKSWDYWPILLGLSGLFAALAQIYPSSLALLNQAWTRLGLLLFKVVSPVALGIIFFLTVMPIGLLLRAFGKDLLGLAWQPDAATYWITRTPPGPPPGSLNNQF